MKKSISIWVSCLSLPLSVIAVCAAFWRSPDLSFDYQGVIVGVLSLLVTVLIGWNLYTVIDFNKKEKELNRQLKIISKYLDNADKIELNTNAMTEQAIASIYLHLLGYGKHIPLEYEYVKHCISSMVSLSILGHTDTCSVIVSIVIDIINNPEQICISDDKKKDLLLSINNVQNPKNIAGIERLLELVARFKTA